MRLTPGTRLGPFEILAPVGAGGMGEVYRARDARLGRDLAVKVLPENVSADESRLRRFEREARAASTLNHPNIVTVFDVGTANGCSYLATEFVEGTTLRALINPEGMRPADVVEIGAQIADGLAAAAGAGLVHRDLTSDD